ncbi:acyltransferase [Propionivibrio sp.]|uniref:acyltransferase n=1 Tax=Propionivibrio sp. TaxID=2212460 RepID=UPI003BF3D2F0
MMASSKEILALGLCPLATLANHLTAPWQRLWAFARLKACLPDVSHSVVVMGLPELHGSRAIALGRNLYLYRDLYLETQAKGFIQIGDDVVLSRGVHLVAFAGITIGAGSMIGEYASIRDANHCFGDGLAIRDSGHAAAPVKIGRNVWIGRGACILSGVEIGDGAVVGANAVVTHHVPANAVVAGVPARMLGQAVAA